MLNDKSCIHACGDSPNQKFDQRKNVVWTNGKKLPKLSSLFAINFNKTDNIDILLAVADEVKQKSGGDFLTCGGCRKKYDLSDLTKFVQHKVLDCNKENADLSKGNKTISHQEHCSNK